MVYIGTGVTPAGTAQQNIYGSAPRTAPLSDVVSGMVFDVDATIAASYDGSSQYVRNLIANPADGALQEDYDFTLGAASSPATNDPTFNGSANDAGAYFSFDGGDFFEIDQPAAGAPAFINNLHKSQDFWFCAAIRMPNDDTGGIYANLMGTGATIGFKGIAVRLVTLPAPYARLNQIGDNGWTQADSAAGVLSYGSDAIIIVSHSHSNNSTRFWLNSMTGQSTTHSFDPATADSGRFTTLASGASGTTAMNNGALAYHFSMGDHFLDDTGAAAIINQLQIRHNRSYTS